MAGSSGFNSQEFFLTLRDRVEEALAFLVSLGRSAVCSFSTDSLRTLVLNRVHEVQRVEMRTGDQLLTRGVLFNC
jgi:hypothetical protein